MRAIQSLRQLCRITLFTRTNCGLCDNAKTTLSEVQRARPFKLVEVNIDDKGAQAWKDIYDFDVPVIHLSSGNAGPEDPHRVSDAVKLMHRFSREEVLSKMKEAAGAYYTSNNG